MAVLLPKSEFFERAKLAWDKTDEKKRIRLGNRYEHFFKKFRMPYNDWKSQFRHLTTCQQNILIKKEFIKYYDSLPNHDKTVIKDKFGLSSFSSKWYRLSSEDKRKLLVEVL